MHEPLHLAWWNFAPTRILTTSCAKSRPFADSLFVTRRQPNFACGVVSGISIKVLRFRNIGWKKWKLWWSKFWPFHWLGTSLIQTSRDHRLSWWLCVAGDCREADAGSAANYNSDQGRGWCGCCDQHLGTAHHAHRSHSSRLTQGRWLWSDQQCRRRHRALSKPSAALRLRGIHYNYCVSYVLP